MKNIHSLFCLSIAVIIISCSSTSPKGTAILKGRYKINGEVTGLNSGWVYLKHTDETGQNIVDSAAIQNQKFTFTGKQNMPEQVTLSLKKRRASVKFFLDNAEIKITASADSFFNAKITGSPAQDQYTEYQNRINPIENEIASLNKMLSESSSPVNESNSPVNTDSIKRKLETLENLKNREVEAFVKRNPSSIVAARVIVSNYLWNPEVNQLSGLYNSLDTQIQQSQYGKTIKEHLDIAIRLAIGKTAPDFSEPDMNGNPIALSSLRGKFVLVNFWASWCGPCRLDNPHLVKTYNKFKSKDFTIIGVSLDHDKQAWIDAVKKDKLDWYHVSDLKGLSNKVMQEYGVWVTPTSYLLDKQGTIIGRNLFGEKLDEKLTEVLN